ncbi:MAG TPA: hypothetical protein VEC93_21245 [Anaerolineae bacterium]|nr:hypothetical protein [Anaerolineae bacterium]
MDNQADNKKTRQRLPWEQLGLTLLLALGLAAAMALSLGLLRPDETLAQGSPFIYTVSPRDNVLRVIDPTTAETIAGVMIRLPGKTVEGGVALTAHPTTGELFALLKIQGQNGRELVKINPSTGLATSAGNTGNLFASISFNAAGTLYGVTGDGATPSETLFTISTTNASTTVVQALGNGDDGEVIAFNPDDGLLYHTSGRGPLNDPITGTIFETINVTTSVVTTIPLASNHPGEEVLGMVYIGANTFLVSDLDLILYRLTTSGGVVTTTNNLLDHSARGFARSNLGPPPSVACGTATLYGVATEVDSNLSTLYSIDPASGAGILIGPTGFEDVRGLDAVSTTILYATGQTSTGTDVLLTINPCSGLGTQVGPLGFSESDISFRNADSVLFGFSDNANELTTIDSSTGAATLVGATGITGTGNGLAFSPGDVLFHADDINLNTLNQATGVTLTTVALTFSPPITSSPEINALEFQPTTGILFGSLDNDTPSDNESYLTTIVTGTGVINIVGQSVNGLNALAFNPKPITVIYLPLIHKQ